MTRPSVISVVLMLTIAPTVAATALVCSSPSHWGGSIDLVTIAGMAVFGLFTVPLWATYIPVLVLVPVVMQQVSHNPLFRTTRLPLLLCASLSVGAIVGVMVLGLPILLNLDAPKLMASWAAAGATSGGITLCLIVLVYRRAGNGKEGRPR